jgi:hypothetical protein
VARLKLGSGGLGRAPNRPFVSPGRRRKSPTEPTTLLLGGQPISRVPSPGGPLPCMVVSFSSARSPFPTRPRPTCSGRRRARRNSRVAATNQPTTSPSSSDRLRSEQEESATPFRTIRAASSEQARSLSHNGAVGASQPRGRQSRWRRLRSGDPPRRRRRGGGWSRPAPGSSASRRWPRLPSRRRFGGERSMALPLVPRTR